MRKTQSTKIMTLLLVRLLTLELGFEVLPVAKRPATRPPLLCRYRAYDGRVPPRALV